MLPGHNDADIGPANSLHAWRNTASIMKDFHFDLIIKTMEARQNNFRTESLKFAVEVKILNRKKQCSIIIILLLFYA